MVITDIKRFNNVCKIMEKFCRLNKGDEERIYHNVFFIDKNLMASTDGKFLAISDMSGCVINTEKFAFPCNIKPTKVVTLRGDMMVIENKKDAYFNNDKKEMCDLNWKRVIPTLSPKVEKIYDFSDYNFTLSYDEHSVVTFYENGEVEFKYNDFSDVVATYEDVQVSENSMFEDEYKDKSITKVSFPMFNIMNILKLSKRFIYREFDDDGYSYSPRVFIIKDYKFIVLPLAKGIDKL